MNFVAPNYLAKAFTCPHCGVLARQYKWAYSLGQLHDAHWEEGNVHRGMLKVARCEHCGAHCLWMGDSYVYPLTGNAPLPNPDMPDEVKADYVEAAQIYEMSPRGAAALLRLSLQKLMIHLGQPGKNINEDIRALVKSGLPSQIQQALDVVRVTGNNAVHPGQLDANDTDVALQLFPLLNVIVEYQISLPARVSQMYAALPEAARVGIQKRDGDGD